MYFEATNKGINELALDVLAIPLSDSENSRNLIRELGEQLNINFEEIIRKIPEFFEKGKIEIVFTREKPYLVMLGGVPDESVISIGKALGRIAKKAKEYKASIIGVIVDHLADGEQLNKIIQTVSEAFSLSSYEFNKYKKEKKAIDFKILVLTQKLSIVEANESLERGSIIAEGVNLARDLVNEPANEANPVKLANFVTNIFSGLNVKVTIYDEKYLQENGFGGIIAVGKGSDVPPRLVVIEYNPVNGQRPVALVGKGVCFDSGGLDLKTREGMERMKIDMAGAAAVIGTIYSIAKLSILVNVVGVIPLVENMPSGKATKPGDVIKMYNGKYVEVVNTDAEGRLILADAISFVERRFRPRYIIDLATLTGACVIALGNKIAGIMGNDKELINDLIKSGEETNELLWELPLHKEYKENLKSEVADLRNISRDRGAGAIIGGLFLSEFLDNSSWAHLDIAGVVYSDKESSLNPRGATGFGVRLLLNFLINKSLGSS